MAGDGDAALCNKVYFGSRAAAAALPGYLISTDGQKVRHGLLWELSFDIPKELWPRFFSLGESVDEAKYLGRGEGPFDIDFAVAVGWYPGKGQAVGRFSARARLFSLFFPESPLASFVHF